MMSNNLRFYGTILLIVEFLIVAMGVRFVQLLAPISLVCVIFSILACYAGAVEKTLYPDTGQRKSILTNAYVNATQMKLSCVNGYPGYGKNLGSNYPSFLQYSYGKEANPKVEVFQDVKTTFFLILAIYFPAVTGILTGTNMSGDLANPQKSIPGGTIAAQLTTSFIYFSLALVFGAAINPELLRDKYGQSLHGGMVVASLAWPSEWVLLIGSFLSTFGAALQCLCSAPRLLQSIAKDDVIPFLQPFSKVTKKNEPFYGLIITTFIAELGILMGAMDNIAAVVDFFFLMCYAFVNIICALHSILGAPNWRPRYVYYHCAKKEWGDGIRGLALTTAQYSLMQISEKDPHPKNWRPQLLILHSMPWSKELVDVRYLNLLNFAAQMKAGKGLTMVVSFLRGNPSNEEDMKAAQQVKTRMENDMQQLRLRGFAKTLLYDEDQIGGSVNALIQSIGIGGLKPNTLLLSWPTREPSEDQVVDSEYQTFTDKLLAGAVSGMALVVAKGITDFPNNVKLNGHLDVYWIVRDGGLCLLITFLLRQSKVWRHCKIRIIAVARQQENSTKLKQQLQTYVYQLRIDAEILVKKLGKKEISTYIYFIERSKMLKQMQRRGIANNRQMNEPGGDSDDRALPNSSPQAEDTSSSNDSSQKEQPLENNEEIGDKVSDNDEGDEQNRKESTHYLPRQPSLPFTEMDGEKQKRLKALDRKKVHKMHGAIRLNELILEHSNESQLVLFSLPKPPTHKDDVDDYIHYLEVISDKLQRVLFVRGTGAEVITTSS
uniref:Uncharacterized protein n=1 Tax=Meloidogyne javanica TaxID=6303 RepID=A0A915LXG2_MELJA